MSQTRSISDSWPGPFQRFGQKLDGTTNNANTEIAYILKIFEIDDVTLLEKVEIINKKRFGTTSRRDEKHIKNPSTGAPFFYLRPNNIMTH